MTQAIFLSYASQDADAARRICDALRAAGLEVWFDQSELRGGDAWDQSIRKQIKECALFVPIISATTNGRNEGYFRLEWKLAVDRSHLMADDQAFFVPVIIDDTPEPSARVPEKFRERQWSRLTDEPAIIAFAGRVRELIAGDAPETKVSPPAMQAPARASVAGARESVAAAQIPEPNVSVRAPLPAAELPARRLPEQAASATYRRPLLATVVALALVAGVSGWWLIDKNRKAAFIAESLIGIESLSRSTKYLDAFRLAQEVERAGGTLTPSTLDSYSRAVNVQSTPPGAAIAIQPFAADSRESEWIELGTAPLEKIRVPRGAMEWRAVLPGYQIANLAGYAGPDKQLSFVLWAAGAAGAAMVPVSGGEMSWGSIPGLSMAQKVKLEPYLIDREEVTNKEFARFVRAGGYAREEFWKAPFGDGATTLTFKEAIVRFKDATGRTGPTTWKLGSYPDGEADLPVRGISWYEAAAYAAFAGKELPTIYHWYFADTGGDRFAMPGILLPVANFESNAIRPAANARSVSAFGAVNMAGNVREWVSNATDRGRRLAVGGSLTDTAYQYAEPVPRSGFERGTDIGVRCMKRNGTAVEADPAMMVLNEKARQDPGRIKPVSDAEYAVVARFFEQRTTPLDVKVESIDSSSPHWVRHKVSFAAGYGGERLNAFLYLPKNAKPPYQTLVFVSGSNMLNNKRTYNNESDLPGWNYPNMLLRGGRAVLFPILKGTFERSDGYEPTAAYLRAHSIQWVSELRQSISFLATRAEIDVDRIGYHGVSFGAKWGVVFLALEPKLKTGILMVGGMTMPLENGDIPPPEINNATYAPRVKASVLMLNGRSDLIFPYETSQVPLYKLLGSPPGKKKHKIYPGGHFVFGWYDDMVKDTHDWLDEQFGPVTPAGQK